MKRTVKTAEIRQDEILDAAQQLFAERGYAKTSVQAIIHAVGIAKGTFYHHFTSKSELLDAMVQRVADEIFTITRPVVDDPALNAPDKLLAFFQRAASYKAAQAGFMVDLSRAIELDANVQVKVRLREITAKVMVGFLETIIAQGVREGSFHCRHPQHTARHLLAVFEASREIWLQAMAPGGAERFSRDDLLELVASQQDDIERLLGAKSGSLQLIDPSLIDQFLDAARTRR